MKVIGLLAPATAMLALVVSLAGRADDVDVTASRRVVQSVGGVQGKVQYCKDCHGLSAQGYYGFLTMPRLAGQKPEYIENQLRAFAERRRGKGIFLNMARIHGLSPEMRTALAAQFSRLNPPSIGRGPKNLSGSGKTIYDDGMPEANVPACSACHGPQAEGEREIPRLAGQLYPYLIRQLTNWNRERQNESAAIMEPIAHGLTKSQMEAVAAYVSSLR
jgi:cytochrome c553